MRPSGFRAKVLIIDMSVSPVSYPTKLYVALYVGKGSNQVEPSTWKISINLLRAPTIMSNRVRLLQTDLNDLIIFE